MLRSIIVLASVLVLTACNERPGSTGAGSGSKPDAAKTDHDHEHDHEAGSATALGSVTLGDVVVAVSREEAIAAGEEAHIDVDITSGAASLSALRIWIGTEDGAGSVKTNVELEGTGGHAHVDTPKPLPAGARVWLEAELKGGARKAGSVEIK
jgi:hypothetical protein